MPIADPKVVDSGQVKQIGSQDKTILVCFVGVVGHEPHSGGECEFSDYVFDFSLQEWSI